MIVAADDVEAAFGRALAAFFRDETTGMRPRVEGNRNHVIGCRHLEIQRFQNLPFQPRHVLVADMAPVLAQMRGNAIGASFYGKVCRTHRIGEDAAPRIAQGRDMIDIDAETQVTRPFHYPFTRSTLLTTGRARKCET